jgi:hypothetical protein
LPLFSAVPRLPEPSEGNFITQLSSPYYKANDLSAIAYGVGHMNGAGGLEGWRWLFIIEGIPSGENLVRLLLIQPC